MAFERSNLTSIWCQYKLNICYKIMKLGNFEHQLLKLIKIISTTKKVCRVEVKANLRIAYSNQEWNYILNVILPMVLGNTAGVERWKDKGRASYLSLEFGGRSFQCLPLIQVDLTSCWPPISIEESGAKTRWQSGWIQLIPMEIFQLVKIAIRWLHSKSIELAHQLALTLTLFFPPFPIVIFTKVVCWELILWMILETLRIVCSGNDK